MANTIFLEPGTDATQDLTFFTGTTTANGTIATDSTQSQDGPRSLKAALTSNGGVAFAYKNDVLADAGRAISLWVRFSSVGPATAFPFLSLETNSAIQAILGIGMNTNGTLRICGRSCTAVDGAVALSANTWYRVSLGYIITSSTNWSATLRFYDTTNTLLETISTSNTQGTLGSTGTAALIVGIDPTSNVDTWGSSPTGVSVFYDSIYIDDRTDKSDPGNIHVTAKRPNANGTTNGFTTQVGSGGSGYGTGHSPQVNEQPLSVTNGWSIAAASAITEEYNIESASTGDVNISTATLVDYMGWLYTKAVLSETAQIIVNNVTSNISIPTNANTLFIKAAGSTSYPAGTGTDIGEITATTVTTVSLFECGIIFAYIPSAAVTQNSNFLTFMGPQPQQ